MPSDSKVTGAAGKSPAGKRRILLMTNAEHGQANVIIAVGHTLLELGHEVHIASFPSLRDVVEKALPRAQFHELVGSDMKAIWENDPVLSQVGKQQAGMLQLPSIWTMPQFLKVCFRSVFPWEGPDYCNVYKTSLEVIERVKPDMCAIDPALNPALTACRASGQPFIMLAPNTIKDFALGAQPYWDQFSKYPW